jgi:hypothetical protein
VFTIPDKGEGDSNIQSQFFQEDLEVLVEGLNGLNCVLSGCAVTGGADMTPEVAKGAVLSNGTLYPIAAGTVTIGTADSSNPRIDLVVVNSSGALAVRAGTAAAAPKPPARSTNDVVLASVYVPAGDTAIATSQISDRRVMVTQGPITLAKVTTAVTINTTNTIQTLLSCTLPSGLFLAGRQLRVRLSGNYLQNQATGTTWTFTISYGGTTMFADATASAAQDADRGGWYLDLTLNASANAAQQLNGVVTFQTPGTKTAPTSGTAGDLAVTTSVDAAIRGSASVDSDAGDRVFKVEVTMSVSNANVETVMDAATVELL